MKENKINIGVNKPVSEVFNFCITPPNSARWIPGVTDETTTEWPITVGTTYNLRNTRDELSAMTVVDFKQDEFIEWVSEDGRYHCRYTFRSSTPKSTELLYHEWAEGNDIEDPFTEEILNKLKTEIENS